MKRIWISVDIVIGVLAVITLIAVTSVGVGFAQTPDTFDIVLSDAPGGFSGGIMRVDVLPGVQGSFADVNCNGNEDFADVVQMFVALSTMNPVTDCRSIGTVFEVQSVSFPGFGLDQVNSQGVDFIEFAVTDVNQILEPSAADSLIATIELNRLTSGNAGIVARWIRFDDELGNTLPQPLIKGVVR